MFLPTYDTRLQLELSKSAHGPRVNEIVAQFFEIVLTLCLDLPDELDDNERILLSWLSSLRSGTLVVVAPPYKLHFRRDAAFPIFILHRVEYPH
ncbi:hypothetical protein [Bradyrhizobium guangdongense]|uniref:hypothetical protein n=1 Tax=Bradyrhizobium guangdongense TaxID=1325090 RepID=UPI0011298249|nr:hypothetical protein [Bradyrhizobium guangdongense]